MQITYSHFLLCFFVLFHFTAISQDTTKVKHSVASPLLPSSTKEFTLTEGTWMNLDVSPDGSQLVFDLLGDIYIMPITGGKATLLRGGHPYEVQPRFNMEGSKISFTSDAGGGDNIWVMNLDGSDAKQVTQEDFRLLNNAVWSHDGKYLLARKHFTSTRSAGAGEIWKYHIAGGEGLQLTKRKNDQQDVGEPFISPDGRYVYFSEDMYPGGFFQYNKDPNSQIYIIKCLDLETGEIQSIIQGPGGAARPTLSRDGKMLAFVRRVHEQTVLFLHDLKTGEQWPIYAGLSKDQQEAWALFGVYTNFNWMPDNKSIVFWANGKINKINTETSELTNIPFEVTSKHTFTEALHFQQEAAPDSVEIKAIRNAVTSPDGKILVFNAAGYLWTKQLPTGKPERLYNSDIFGFEPSFSADGKKLVWVSWDDESMGAIMVSDMTKRNAKPIKITKEKGIFRQPAFSPDGKTIVFMKEEGNGQQGFSFCKNPGIYLVPADASGEMKFVCKDGEYPIFNKDGSRIYLQRGGYLFGDIEKKLVSVELNGFNEREHFSSKHAQRIIPSPDNEWVAFIELFKVYIAPFVETGKKVELNSKSKAYPVKQVTRDAGISIHWIKNEALAWTLGDAYFSRKIAETFSFHEEASNLKEKPDSAGVSIGLRLKHDKPSGFKAFTNARIITMNGDEVIENGIILTKDNRIEAVGKVGEVNIPDATWIQDCKGKTIMPGIIDVHAHLGTFRYGLSPNQEWSYFANLAYGVTTTHDPSSNTEMVFSQSEAVKTGSMVGPRIFSTGIILYGAEGDFKAVINTTEDARSAIRRTKAFGAFSVKSYNQPRREQRQMVIEAAQKEKMLVVPEGGSHFLHNMSMILDGHTGIEHNIPVSTIYDDVIKFWSASKTGYTPTLIVSYGSVTGEYYWYQHDEVWKKERLLRFTPRAYIDPRARHRTMIPEEEYTSGYIEVSRSCKKLFDAGVKVNLGAHGQIQGIGAHWELWMLAQGGMSPLESIRCATVNGAYYIGMEKDLGKIQTGMLADFLVLEKNPLENIRNSESIQFTIANGRVYNAETMQELGPGAKSKKPFYWENSKAGEQFEFHEETHLFHEHNCGCRK